jgi:hypothetical protein
VRLSIPNSGQWHAVVDMQGLQGSVRAGFRVVNADALRPLPPIQQQRTALSEIANNLATTTPTHEARARKYDVFISHAAEDKDALVRPLAAALQSHGLSVWYDEFELHIGDSLRRKIDAGMAASRFGLVVLSQAFFAKSWPQYELDGLVTLSVTGKQVLLPLWHNISMDEVMRHSPSLSDKVALRTSDYSVTEIAVEVASVINSDPGS